MNTKMYPKIPKKVFGLLALSIASLMGASSAYAQANQVYPDGQLTYHSPGVLGIGAGSISNAPNAVGANLTNYAVLNGGSLLNWAEIQLEFDQPLTTGSTVYLRVNNSDDVTVSAYTGSNFSTSTSGTVAAANLAFTQMYNASGELYLAVTPAAGFNAIRIRKNYSLLSPTVNVYGAFALQANPLDCGQAWAYSTSYSGITLGWAEIVNPSHAFSGPAANYASFNVNGSFGSLAYSMEETVYFDGPANSGDAVRLEFSDGIGLLDISLFDNAKIQVFNGNTAVGTAASLSNLLSLDFFGLSSIFGSLNRNVVIYVPPANAVFDRVRITYEVPLGWPSVVNQLLRVYDVKRIPQATQVSGGSSVAICPGQSTTLVASSPQAAAIGAANLTYRWYDSISGGTLLHTGASFTTPSNLVSDKVYWVEVQKGSCGQPSVRVADTVKIKRPIAVSDADSTHQALPVSIAVTANDTLLCGNFDTTAPITITVPPAHGTAVINGFEVIYTPAVGFQGADSFKYTIKDNHGMVSLPAKVTIRISNDVLLPTDLTPVINMPNQNFNSASMVKPFNIRLFNLADGNTSDGTITVVVTKASSFSFALSAASANEWLLSTIGSNIVVLTSKPGYHVTNGTYKQIALVVTAAPNTPKGSGYIFNVSLEDGSGGDINNSNNSVSIKAIVN